MFSMWMAVPNHPSPHLLPPKVYINRELESGAELGLDVAQAFSYGMQASRPASQPRGLMPTLDTPFHPWLGAQRSFQRLLAQGLFLQQKALKPTLPRTQPQKSQDNRGRFPGAVHSGTNNPGPEKGVLAQQELRERVLAPSQTLLCQEVPGKRAHPRIRRK